MDSWAERTHSKVVAGGPGEVAAGRVDSPTFVCSKLGGTIGERDRLPNPGFWHGKIKPQILWL